MTDAVETPAVESKPVKAPATPRKRKAAAPQPEPVVVVPLTDEEVAANLTKRQKRLESAYDVADMENDGPRADAVWRSLSRINAQLNTLVLSASLS